MDALILLTLSICLLSLYSSVYIGIQIKKKGDKTERLKWTRSIYLMSGITIIAAIITIWLIIFTYF
ncbi:hypothetical protein AJ85_07215 [Alkalihalobacillus alcalophilus ATCC 27647 = CGMCC 1.3604]|uniref:Uncharacterized protein n=1 Tax=Alkalihalobacillus alcalophilus ATCC 27647 = CGMCC 1.3604 TaxID=1218173 RepID=A0A094WMH6_ALKAL|nr:hypothetical protein [Alkalihalobacillus alcalophilus]KGA98066.1 hypothetical protein BALCAV_0206605 [Alkalihalobacillus alcalophilus ATCC 27647 = CGMCC 1.3604]MED1561048.1 hypothetical protein [Alkalihalobacillus alcalophilus]THG88329.1 hypothetical protein AJ85_07215 [Alkalihalobacillus alcalophilus ATCC 27647 = CGMCC 1.3604]